MGLELATDWHLTITSQTHCAMPPLFSFLIPLSICDLLTVCTTIFSSKLNLQFQLKLSHKLKQSNDSSIPPPKFINQLGV